jgi:hypothetical protein
MAGHLVVGFVTGLYIPWLEHWWVCNNASDFSSCSGFLKDSAQQFSEFMRKNISVIQPSVPAGRNGILLPNGTWIGIVADVSQLILVDT